MLEEEGITHLLSKKGLELYPFEIKFGKEASTMSFRPSQQNVSFPIARLTHFFRKVKKHSRFTSQRSKYFNLQAHVRVLFTAIGMI